MDTVARIIQLTEKKGVTRYEIAQATGISEATLARMWSGKTQKPQRDNVKLLAEYFEVNEDWLLTGEGNPERDEAQTNLNSIDMLREDLVDELKRRGRQIDDLIEQQSRLISIIETLSGSNQSRIG